MKKKSFDKSVYLIKSAEVINLIKETLPDWEKTQGFVVDGIYEPDIYENQKIKILFILSETYGYDKCGAWNEKNDKTKDDLFGCLKNKILSKINSAKLLWLIFKSVEENRELSSSDFPRSWGTNIFLEALLKTALVNVKKLSRHDGHKQNNNEVYNHAINNREILKKQIASIAPDLIIVCGDVAINSINYMKLLGSEICNKKCIVQENELGQKIINLNHPSYRGKGMNWSNKNIYEYYKTIYNSIKQA